MENTKTLAQKLNRQLPTLGEINPSQKKILQREQAWGNVLNIMFQKIDKEFAYRLATINPIVELGKTAPYNSDFKKFTDYFSHRRDVEKCSDMETALLAVLHTAVQKKIDLLCNP